jgi:hypothetical protein
MSPSDKGIAKAKAKEGFKITQELGVPAGGDGLWEFANLPSKHYETLGRETHALMEMGLINEQYKRHPVHITLGGVKTTAAVDALARGLEATGWSTTWGRLVRPALKDTSWNHKGRAGIRNRPEEELELGSESGVELRTFQLQSLDGLHRTLAGAYYLGSALRAWQLEREDPSDEDSDRNRLARVWGRYSEQTKDLFQRYGVPEPGYSWDAPELDDESTGFWKLSNLLRHASEDKESDGAKFVSEMRKIVITARRDAKQIMYPAKDSARS